MQGGAISHFYLSSSKHIFFLLVTIKPEENPKKLRAPRLMAAPQHDAEDPRVRHNYR